MGCGAQYRRPVNRIKNGNLPGQNGIPAKQLENGKTVSDPVSRFFVSRFHPFLFLSRRFKNSRVDFSIPFSGLSTTPTPSFALDASAPADGAATDATTRTATRGSSVIATVAGPQFIAVRMYSLLPPYYFLWYFLCLHFSGGIFNRRG
jgi:hypothetical protein